MASIQRRYGVFNRRRRIASGLSHEFGSLAHALKELFSPYRPELHYMRGPGPKWHAKHDGEIEPVEQLATAPARRAHA
jgi:hypothetical protein